VEWADKPVSIMCYGNHGGFLGAMAMRLVTQGLHMTPLSTNIPINIEDEMFDESGQFKDISGALEPYRLPAELASQEFASIFRRYIRA
jgi:hypothetical protein